MERPDPVPPDSVGPRAATGFALRSRYWSPALSVILKRPTTTPGPRVITLLNRNVTVMTQVLRGRRVSGNGEHADATNGPSVDTLVILRSAVPLFMMVTVISLTRTF